MKNFRYKLLGTLVIPLASGVWADNNLLPDVAVSEVNNHIVINIPNVRLYFYSDGAYDTSFPIAAGKILSRTPVGSYQIGARAHNPTWYIPASIQKERKQKGLPDIKSIPPGPNNPLGPLFIRFGEEKLSLGIHGTNVPSSVPGIRSHGCIRMKNTDLTQLDKKVNRGDSVSVIYQLYALNVDEDNQLWFRKYSNPYNIRNQDLNNIKTAISLWQKQNQQHHIDEKKFNQLLKKIQSNPSCLTCSQKNPKIKGKLQSIAWTDGRADIRTPDDYSKSLDKLIIDSLLYNPILKSPRWIWEPKYEIKEPKNNDDLTINSDDLF